MRLINVRKGQFVYFDNILHKVYSVKPFFKQSVHLIRLEDFEQQLATAREIDYYKPKHLDSFISNETRYTLNKDKRAEVGDYILVINPRPDSLDRHYLHAIELVSLVEENGVITNKSNGIKHTEYWVMEEGLKDGATIIDLQQSDPEYEREAKKLSTKDAIIHELDIPKVGNVYQKNNSDPTLLAMVLAIEGRDVFLGGNIKVSADELADQEKWRLMYHVREYSDPS